MQRKVGAALVAALVLGLAGCGGGEPLSRAELTQRANAICRAQSARLNALQQRLGREGKLASPAAVKAAVPIARERVQELAALKPAASVDARYAAFVAWERRSLAVGEQQLARLASGQPPRPRDRGQAHEEGMAHARVTTALGLRDCLT
jgi:hypothetical protein